MNCRLDNSFKIILACENEEPGQLVEAVQEIILSKIYEAVDAKKKEMGSKFFNGVSEESKNMEDKDTYESFEPKEKEAIDHVVEAVLEQNLDMVNTIESAAKSFNVDEGKLHQYFKEYMEIDACVETGSKKISNADKMDDMDVNRRVRNESFMEELIRGGELVFENKTSIMVSSEQGKAIMESYNQLSDSLQGKMVQKLQKDQINFLNILDFAQKFQKKEGN